MQVGELPETLPACVFPSLLPEPLGLFLLEDSLGMRSLRSDSLV